MFKRNTEYPNTVIAVASQPASGLLYLSSLQVPIPTLKGSCNKNNNKNNNKNMNAKIVNPDRLEEGEGTEKTPWLFWERKLRQHVKLQEC